MKRHFSSKIFFSCVIWKYFFETILNILKCHYNILKKKISFYQNVFLSQYCVQKCLVFISPKCGIQIWQFWQFWSRPLNEKMEQGKFSTKWGPRHTQSFCTHYCDKKDIFHPIFFHHVNWKYLFLDSYVPHMSMDTRMCIENHHWYLWFENILKCNCNILTKNIFLSFYWNIFSSQHRCEKKIVCDVGFKNFSIPLE